MFVMERAQVLVAVDQSQSAIVPVLKLGMILLPVQGASGPHYALPRKGNGTLRLALFSVEAEPMPCRNLLQEDHDGAHVVDCIVGVRDCEDGVVIYPRGAIQIQSLPRSWSPWLQRIAVQVLHADQESVLNQALAQTLHVTTSCGWKRLPAARRCCGKPQGVALTDGKWFFLDLPCCTPRMSTPTSRLCFATAARRAEGAHVSPWAFRLGENIRCGDHQRSCRLAGCVNWRRRWNHRIWKLIDRLPEQQSVELYRSTRLFRAPC